MREKANILCGVTRKIIQDQIHCRNIPITLKTWFEAGQGQCMRSDFNGCLSEQQCHCYEHECSSDHPKEQLSLPSWDRFVVLAPECILTRHKFLAEYRNEDCQQSEQQKENVYYPLSAHQGNGKRWGFGQHALIVISHQLAKVAVTLDTPQ
jgi:hypothetical protein